MVLPLDKRLHLKKTHLKQLEKGESLELSVHYNFFEECKDEHAKQGQPYSRFQGLMDHVETFYRKAGVPYTRVDHANIAQGTIYAQLQKEHLEQILKEKGVALVTV